MGEKQKEELPDPSTLNPFDPNLEPEVVERIAALFISFVRKQGEYHPEGGKGKKVTHQKPSVLKTPV